MPTVRVRGLDSPVEVEAGKDLRAALRDGNVNVFWGPWAQALNCRGKGFCNLCKVRVLEGGDQLAPRTKREAKRLKRRPDDWRLACQTRFKGKEGEILIQAFPVIRPEERVQPEAVHRAKLTPEARAEEEAADRERLRPEHADKKEEKGEKKRRLLPFGKKKEEEDEQAQPAQDAGKGKGLKVLGRKKKGDDAEEAPARKKGKPAKQEDVKADARSETATETPEKPAKPAAKPEKKKFALKGKK